MRSFLLILLLGACQSESKKTDKTSTTADDTATQSDDTATQSDDTATQWDDAGRAAAVEAVYEKLEEYVNGSMPELQDSDGELSFTLSNVTTIPEAQFGEVLWLDLVDMPGGKMVSVNRTEVFNRPSEQSYVYYGAEWVDWGDYDFLESDDGKLLPEATAGDILTKAESKIDDFSHVDGITHYDVTLSLAGEERSYKAMALWSGGDKIDEATMLPLDYIAQGVREAAIEMLPLTLESDPDESKSSGDGSDKVCTENEDKRAPYNTVDNGTSDNTKHVIGEHLAVAPELQVTCNCASDCTSTCSSEWTGESPYCGASLPALVYGRCHVGTKEGRLSADEKVDGDVNRATCGGAWVCAVSAEFLCISGLSIGFTPPAADGAAKFGIQIGGGGKIWDTQLNKSVECGLCEQTGVDGAGDLTGTADVNITFIDYMDPSAPIERSCSLDATLNVSDSGMVTGSLICETDVHSISVKIEFSPEEEAAGERAVEISAFVGSDEAPGATLGSWSGSGLTEGLYGWHLRGEVDHEGVSITFVSPDITIAWLDVSASFHLCDAAVLAEKGSCDWDK